MALSLETLAKRVSALEDAHSTTTKLTLATDRGLQRERCRHQLIGHFRGVFLDQVVEAWSDHKDEKQKEKEAADDEEFQSADEEKRSKSRRTSRELGLPEAGERAAAAANLASKSWKTKLWAIVLNILKARALAASEVGKFHIAQAAVTTTFAWDAVATLQGVSMHSDEPVDEEVAKDKHAEVWHCTFDFRFGDIGSKAVQTFLFELQPFSYGDFIFHAANPRPGKLAKDAAEAAKVSLPGKGNGKGSGNGRGRKPSRKRS